MKKELCKAFCDELKVTDVPVGLAISTSFRREDGDAVAFYVVRDPNRPGYARLEDDGTTIPFLEAAGVDFETQTRSAALHGLLDEYQAEFNSDDMVIRTRSILEANIPRVALNFVALLIRMPDFLLLRQDHVESVFKEDAVNRIRSIIGQRASIKEETPVSSRLKEVVPDLVIQAPSRDPVAVFLANSVQRVNDAIFLQMAALYEAREPLSVIAVLEKDSTVSSKLKQRAVNRLTTLPVYFGDEDAAVQRIEREVVGVGKAIH